MHAKVEAALHAHTVDYTVHRHDAFSAPIHSPADFSAELGYELPRITKTLLVRSTSGDAYAMVVAPMGKKIDFRGVANLLGVKRVEVASAADLAEFVGYRRKAFRRWGSAACGFLWMMGYSIFRRFWWVPEKQA